MKNADRLNQYINRFYISQHYEDWHPRFFEKYDIEELIRKVDEVNPDAFYASARTHNGKWFCDIGWGPLHKGLHGTDQFKAFLEHLHGKGKPVMAYISAVYDKVLYEEHPDWRQVNKDGVPLGISAGSWGKIVCLNSPYREYIIEAIKALIQKYEVDGFFFDMTFFDKEPCYCPSCRRAFKERFGADIPLEQNWDDPVYRQFVQFRMDSNHSFVRDICAAVKEMDDNLSVCVQYPMMKPRVLCGQSLAVGKEPDYIYCDIYFRTGYLPMSVTTRITSAISKYRPEIGIMTRPGSHNDTPNMKSLNHIRSEAFSVISNGGAIMFFDIMWPDGTVQDEMYKRIETVCREIDQRKAWLGGTPVKTVAVLYSEATRLWYGRENMEERYDTNFLGMCRALIEEHIPYNILTELTDDSLAGYQALVLPNTVCMSADEVKAVQGFVKNGGGLVCTEKTSLWDEKGNPLNEYRLSEVLGIAYAGDTSAFSRVYSGFDMSEPLASRLPPDGLVTSWGTLQKVNLRGARSLARIVYPYAEPTGDKFVNIMANPPAIPSMWPACTLNRYGAGKAIYFAGAIDKDYAKLSFPELKRLIVDAVRQVVAKPLTLVLDAPSCVEMTAYERDEGELVVHLTNFQPEIGKTIIGSTYESRHLIEEILPVYDLKLAVCTEKAPKEVILQPENRKLDFDLVGGSCIIKIPKLECHSMVVISY